MNLHCSEVLQL